MDFKKVDPNLVAETKIDTSDMDFYDIMNELFSIHGVYYSEELGKFTRMPDNIAASVSDGVRFLAPHTAGGRIRFSCNSDEYAIITKQPYIHNSPIMSDMVSGGFDLYIDNVFNKAFRPAGARENKGFQSRICVERYENKMCDITINMPLYGEVSSVLIGVKKGSFIKKATPYIDMKPVVFYGSSITQGASASRPGNAYQSVLSRRLNFDFINLGFSGNCKAEPQMADYINTLDMGVFVYDYDHNAKNLEDLIATHEPFFNMIREKNPTLPVVFMTRPTYLLNETEIKRRDHIKGVYTKIKNSGDDNVYFVDGSTAGDNFAGHETSVDGVHPNDLGFYGMAEKVEKVLEEIFSKM